MTNKQQAARKKATRKKAPRKKAPRLAPPFRKEPIGEIHKEQLVGPIRKEGFVGPIRKEGIVPPIRREGREEPAVRDLGQPPEKIRRAVEAATVRFLNKDGTHRGQGVLVPGPWILTAAHVVHWEHTGAMMAGFPEEEFLAEIVVPGGARFHIYPEAIEPVHDLAVLGAVDGQLLPDDDDAFQAFCAATRPVPLATERIQDAGADARRMVPAYVLAHTGAWVRGRVRQWGTAPSLQLETETLIQGGTSGSPVVTVDGRLLGVASWVSTMTTTDGTPEERPDGWAEGGTIPRPHRAAPLYLVEQMTAKATRKKKVAAR